MICSHAEKNMLTQISQITQNYSYAECLFHVNLANLTKAALLRSQLSALPSVCTLQFASATMRTS